MNAQENEAAQKIINEDFPLALPSGTILAGQYTIDKVLGQGGFGITYMATDYKTKEKVAVKEFFPDSLAYREMTAVISYPGERAENYEYGKENFLQEAKTLAEFIGCENIVRIFSYFEENGTAYFVMEYIDGVSFDNYLKDRGGRISFDEAKNILVPIMEALAIVHSKGIVHRDVTPDNIYITNDGKVKLLDFGAARYSLGDKSKSLDVILKHGFAPKEQYTRRGKQGPFTDIYSLGATLYFSVTGRRPPDSIDRIEEDDLIPPSSIGVKITGYQEEALLHAMEVNPQSRYQSMLDFRNALLNETAPMPASTAVNQQFFNAPLTSAPVQQNPIAEPQMSYPVSEQQTENVSKQIGDAAKQLGSAAVQIGGGVAKQLGSTAKQLGESTAKHLGNAAKQLSEAAAKNNGTTEALQQSDSQSLRSGEAVVPKKSKIGKIFIVLIILLAAVGGFLLLRGIFNGKNSWINGNPVLIGETFGNIQNGGIVTYSDDGSLFYIEYDGHSVTQINDSKKILLNNNSKVYSNLIYDKYGMYYVEDGRICYYDLNKEKGTVFSKLKKYKGDDLQLYISLDYYFVYVDGKLHRISKDKGNEEESISVGSPEKFALCGRYLYYIDEHPEYGSAVYRTLSTDFSVKDGDNYIYNKDSSAYFAEITSDGEWLYTLSKNYNDRDFADFNIINADLKSIFHCNITEWAKSQADSDYSISRLNALDSYWTLILSDNSGGSNLYFGVCTKSSDKNKIDFTLLHNSNEKTYLEYYNDQYQINYYDRDENGALYYHSCQ